MSKSDECYGCTRRKVGCHIDCPDYAKKVELSKQIRAAKYKENIFRGYRSGVIEKILTDDAVRRQKKDRVRRKR